MSDEYEYIKGRAAMNDAKPDRHYQNEAAPWGWLWPCSDDAYAILEGLRARSGACPYPPAPPGSAHAATPSTRRTSIGATVRNNHTPPRLRQESG